MSFPPLLDAWYLTGPTASGKTAVGMALARQLDAEIVSLDSMALYRGLDIGTAKPTASERALVPHHLIDVLDPEDEYSLAQYVATAHAAAADIRARGRQPLFVGGTPLYLKALLRGMFVGPPADWNLRRRLQDQVQQFGNEALHQQLAAVDPAAAARLHPRDTRRIIRAIEVQQLTGTPISQLQGQFDVAHAAEDCRVFVLHWSRQELHRRIDARVDAMFAAGLVAEVESLLARGQSFSRTARQAVGYREVLDHLAGVRPLDETILLVKTRTRQFAKRQATWFRSLDECRSIPVAEPLEPATIARQIAISSA